MSRGHEAMNNAAAFIAERQRPTRLDRPIWDYASNDRLTRATFPEFDKGQAVRTIRAIYSECHMYGIPVQSTTLREALALIPQKMNKKKTLEQNLLSMQNFGTKSLPTALALFKEMLENR